jgi:CubicO group peptidase (beta-lactamase class C family)
MKELHCIIYLTALSVCSQGQDISKKIDVYLSGSKKTITFNGTALVVYKTDILLYKGYGYKNAHNKTLNDTSTIFRIGSLSKSFTAAAILHLEQQHLLRLKDHLSLYIPDYPNGDAITIEHLLTHGSGIRDYLEVKAIREMPDSAPPISINKLISYFKNEPPTNKPGKKFSYSNSNYILLAFIIEKITGEKFEQFTRKIIFDPLHMDHSGFDFRNLQDTNRSTGHSGLQKKIITVEDFDSTNAPGCGSMYTVPMDLYKWYKGLYSNKVINDSTRENAFIPRQWKYGYGWFSYTLYGKKCISHAGGVPGFVAFMQFFPDDDLCIILLNNANEGRASTDRIAGIVFGIPYESSGL